jgi:hypothetical protein
MIKTFSFLSLWLHTNSQCINKAIRYHLTILTAFPCAVQTGFKEPLNENSAKAITDVTTTCFKKKRKMLKSMDDNTKIICSPNRLFSKHSLQH